MTSPLGATLAGLAGIGGALVLAKGLNDLKNEQFDKRMAKAEIIAGGVTLVSAVLKIGFDVIPFSLKHSKKFTECRCAAKSDSFFETFIKYVIAGAAIPVGIFSVYIPFSWIERKICTYRRNS